MSLLTNRFVKEVAFEWGGVKRVYQADTLTVKGDEEREFFKYSNGNVVSNLKQLWLIYEVKFRFLRRISPSADVSNDFVDLRNALIDGAVQVLFYPIHDVDATVSDIVLPTDKGIDMLTVDRWFATPEFTLELITSTSLTSYPVWLRNTYYK